jgi:transposase
MAKSVASPSVPTGSHKPAKQMPTVNPHAAGVDLGNAGHFVCVPADSVPAGQSPVRQFGVFNPELDKMVEWLKQCQVETVAMESTGVMWIPVFQKLEAAGLEVLLVNTKSLKHVPGRKSDVLDCQWIQQLHSYGLLSGSFRPADIICRLRTLVRQRENLISSAGVEIQHMQKALQEMGVHLHVVLSDVTGQTGLRIIDAILGGQRDPKELVKLRDWRVRRSTVGQMEAALQGDWREELLFVLGQSRAAYTFYQGQLACLDEKIIALLAQIPPAPQPPAPSGPEPQAPTSDPAAPALDSGPEATPEGAQQAQRVERIGASRKRKPTRKSCKGGNPLSRDITGQLTTILGVDLTQLPGLNMLSVLIILSEIGTDMKRWRNGDAFAAWLGLCPGSKISGGRVLSSRTPHVVNRVAILLRLAALAIGRTDSCLGIFYRRMKAKHGPAKAMTATARKLAVLIHHLLSHAEAYVEPDLEEYDQRVRRAKIIRLSRQANELGFDLVARQQAA